PRFHPGQLLDRGGRRALRIHGRVSGAQQFHLPRVADAGFHRSARRHRKRVGLGGGGVPGGAASREASDLAGVPVFALRRPGDSDSSLPARGPYPAPDAALLRSSRVSSPSPPLLVCRDLTRRFGGLLALDRFSFELMEGEILGLIGPNGSGKTTFFNVLTGFYRASAGEAWFGGQPITNLRPQEIYRAGISRTFQRSRLCLSLSLF